MYNPHNFFLTLVHKKYLKKEDDDDDNSNSEATNEDSSYDFDTDMYQETEEDQNPVKPPGLGLNLNFGNNQKNQEGNKFSGGLKVGALNLDKARDLQEKMAIRMVEKLKKDVSQLSRDDLVEEVGSYKKENERVVKILSNEIENQLILKKDHKRILTMNKELVRINQVLTSCY